MRIDKRFIVSMLTRDIELEDAILDLLDNCLDGVIRSTTRSLDAKTPYRGYWARITLNETEFEILDNCGGIPSDQVGRAFGIGRTIDLSAPHRTIGIYGIGMKRAIFKMALEAKVQSHSTSAFEVTINEGWMNDASQWDLPFRRILTRFKNGTRIAISRLRPEIAKMFGRQSFRARLNDFISQQYAVIIDKGFRVFINDVPVDAAPLALLSSNAASIHSGKPAFAPYMLRYETSTVRASLWVGMYLKPSDSDSDEESETEQRQSRDTSGWTILCNDRAVVSNDTTILTGWGDAGVPRFHPQFIGIRGIAALESDNPLELPLTTTKRGLDAASGLFLTLKEYMREGTKVFTSFTNHWKADRQRARRLLEDTELLGLSDLRRLMKSVEFKNVRRLEGAQRFEPELPMPAPSDMRRVSFVRHKDQIKLLAERLLENGRAKPADVGAYCFDAAFRRVSKP